MVEERRPVYYPSHAPVNEVAYLDAATRLVTMRERPGRGLLLRAHRFRVAHGRQPRWFTAGALAVDNGGGCGVFASCKGR